MFTGFKYNKFKEKEDEHVDDNSSSVVACSSALPVSVATKPAPSSFPLYDDVLKLVFTFLNVTELHKAIQISQQWHHLLRTMSSLGVTTGATQAQLELIPEGSIIARHIAAASEMQTETADRKFLDRLAYILPNLTKINIRSSEQAYALPSTLREVSVHISSLQPPQPPSFAAIGTLDHLEDLTLYIELSRFESYHALDYTPLLPISHHLRRFWLEIVGRCWLKKQEVEESLLIPPALIELVRQSQIETLRVEIPFPLGSTRYLNRLFQMITATPCKLVDSRSLTSIYLQDVTVNHKILQSLTHFPSLTSLKPWDVDLTVEDLALFEKLPNITDLRTATFENLGKVNCRTPCSTIVIMCSVFHGLESLHIGGWDIVSEQLDSILLHLPKLHEIVLSACKKLMSLAPLVKHGLPQRLKRLLVLECPIGPSDLSTYLPQLVSLEYLNLWCLSEGDMTDSVKEMIRNLPNMTDCTLKNAYV